VRKTHDLIGMKRTVKTETRLSLSYWVRLERITRLWQHTAFHLVCS